MESTYNISQVRDEISNLTRDSADLRDSIDKLAPQLPSLLIYGGDDGTYSNLTTNLINLYTGENNTALGRPNYVQKIEGGLIKGVPVYCGGEDDNITPSDKCFQVGDPINPLATLSVPRTEHSSVVINNDVLFLIGGTTAQYASTPTDTTEFYSNDLGVYSGPKLPIFEFRRGCAALIDVNHVIIIGGLINYFYGSKETWILNLSTSTWTKGPDLDTGRDGHACASVNGVVMVTGGQSLAVTYSELLMTADPTVWATSKPNSLSHFTQ